MKFSLVIPVAPYRDAEIVDSIEKQSFPKKEYEIIIVKGKSASKNRNEGARKAKGEIIGFLDDDATLDENYLENVDKFFKKNKDVDIVGGPQLTPKDDSGFAKISGYALCSKFGAWKLNARYSCCKTNLCADESCITSANLFVKKEVMEKVQFDENLWPGEDPKFIDESIEKGFSIAYSPDFFIYHRRRAKAGEMVKQMFNYGRVRPKKEKISKTLRNPFFFIPSLFFIYLMIAILYSFGNLTLTGNVIGVTGKEGFVFYPLFLYAFLAIVFGISDSAKNHDLMAMFVLPIIYPMIHLSYGMGMIKGYFENMIKHLK